MASLKKHTVASFVQRGLAGLCANHTRFPFFSVLYWQYVLSCKILACKLVSTPASMLVPRLAWHLDSHNLHGTITIDVLMLNISFVTFLNRRDSRNEMLNEAKHRRMTILVNIGNQIGCSKLEGQMFEKHHLLPTNHVIGKTLHLSTCRH